MGHNAFVDGYKRPNFRLHLIIFLTIIGVSVFLSTQVEKNKEKTRIEALKIPVPIDSVFVEENTQGTKPHVEAPKVAQASSQTTQSEQEYRFDSGPNLAKIDTMLAQLDESSTDEGGADKVMSDAVVSDVSSADAPAESTQTTDKRKDSTDVVADTVANQQSEKEKDIAIMVTDDEVAESDLAKTDEPSEITSKENDKTIAKMDAVYELQQDRFLQTLAKTAKQKAEESVEIKRIKEAIRSDQPLKLKSTVKTKPVPVSKDKLVKVATTTTSSMLDSKGGVDAPRKASNKNNVVVAKNSKNVTREKVKNASSIDPVKQITLTKGELNNVLTQFARSYNKGDIKRLMALFDDNAVTNDQKSKLGIKAEYDELFKTTSNRQIRIRNIQWNLSDDKAKGDARFTVTVRPRGSAESAQIEGKIEILAVKEDRGVFIKRLMHEVTAQ